MRALLFLLLLTAGPALAAPSSIPPAEFSAFALRQHPGTQLPLDAMLRDADGENVTLGSFFAGRPVVLDFEYDRCTTLCGAVLDRLSAALPHGARLVAIDIDPEATSREAAAFARAHGAEIVLTGDEATIRRIADAAGFPYRPRPGDRAIRAPGRVPHSDARRPHIALFPRLRLAAARSAAGADRSGRPHHRRPGRAGAAVLLLL